MNEGVIPCPNQSEDNRKGINSVYASARQIILQKNRAEPFKTAEQQQILNLLTAYLEKKKKKKSVCTSGTGALTFANSFKHLENFTLKP